MTIIDKKSPEYAAIMGAYYALRIGLVQHGAVESRDKLDMSNVRIDTTDMPDFPICMIAAALHELADHPDTTDPSVKTYLTAMSKRILDTDGAK